MNRAELAKQVASETGLSASKAREVVEATLGAIMTKVAEGERVRLLGFGTFQPKQRAARRGVNPATGTSLEIPARTVPTFKAGKEFRKAVNG